MKEDARKMVLTMVDMERSYLTADVFRDIISQNGAVDGTDQPGLLRTLSGTFCSCPCNRRSQACLLCIAPGTFVPVPLPSFCNICSWLTMLVWCLGLCTESGTFVPVP